MRREGCGVASRASRIGGATGADADTVGRGQAVRRGTLDPVFEGSNPSAPAIRLRSRSAVSELRRDGAPKRPRRLAIHLCSRGGRA